MLSIIDIPFSGILAADEKLKTAIKPIADAFLPPNKFNDAFKQYVMNPDPRHNIDNYSTREWLKMKCWTYDMIEMAETAETSTGLFDQSFSETIIDYCDFAASDNLPWKRLDGGMSTLTNAMCSSVAGQGPYPISGQGVQVKTNSAVTKMVEKKAAKKISVTLADTSVNQKSPVFPPPMTTKDYTAVFSTTALACLQRMDLSELNLDKSTLTPIRTLSYDRASKVAITFSKNWWKPFMKYDKDFPYGGVSSSDLSISNVVYPSWDDGDGQPAVLMVSYSWAQDATRMGALIPDYSNPNITPRPDDPVLFYCLQQLAELFKPVPGAPDFDSLVKMYVSHHAWAWSHDQWTGGAFALFGPGQFANAYPNLLVPKCEGKFNICGEATSAHHAWISGALDSAYHSVLIWLKMKGYENKVKALRESPLGTGTDQHPAEVDETLVHWVGELAKQRAFGLEGTRGKPKEPVSAKYA